MTSQHFMLAAAVCAGLFLCLFVLAVGRQFLAWSRREEDLVRRDGRDPSELGGYALMTRGLGRDLARAGWAKKVVDLESSSKRAGVAHERDGYELLGHSVVLGVAGFVAMGVMFGFATGLGGGIVGALMGAALYVMPGSSLQGRAADRMRRLLSDMPFALDLMSLVVRGGGAIPEALDAVSRTDPDSPLSQELMQVANEVGAGSSFAESLRRMARRLDHPDVDNLADTFIQGEELGLPLTRILTNLSDTVRARRYEQADAAANESSVKMLGPTMIIMVAVMVLFLFPVIITMSAGVS